jgi:hypothetical protein
VRYGHDIQTIVDEDKHGRVMSFEAMAFMGTAVGGSDKLSA